MCIRDRAITGVFGPSDDDGGEEGEDEGPQPDDDDDDSAEDGEDFDEEDRGEDRPIAAVGLERSVLRRVAIDAKPRVPFLSTARILVAGFSAEDIERGMPRPGARPSFFWPSKSLPVAWPLRTEVRLPEATGTTVFVILDLDDNAQPSPGDLSTPAQPDFEAPSSEQETDYLLNRAYSVTTRLLPGQD